MSLIKQALDKVEGQEKNKTENPEEESAQGREEDGDQQNSISWSLISLAVVIVILSAFIGGQLFLLAWLLVS